MRAGGGKAKGSAWEREAGKQLSLWLTRGARPDIFARNVLSGGTFTNAQKAGRNSSHMPGDLMAANPLAFQFLSLFSIECKHLADLGLETLIYDREAKSSFYRIISFAQGQAQKLSLRAIILAKENRREPIVVMDGRTGRMTIAALLPSRRIQLPPLHHFLHNGRIFVMHLEDLTTRIDPERLLTSLEEAS